MDTPKKRPAQVVANVRAVVKLHEVVATCNQMMSALAANLLAWFTTWPDARTLYELDPHHKSLVAVFSVVMDETCTEQEIADARAELTRQFDVLVADSRPKFSRVELAGAPAPGRSRLIM